MVFSSGLCRAVSVPGQDQDVNPGLCECKVTPEMSRSPKIRKLAEEKICPSLPPFLPPLEGTEAHYLRALWEFTSEPEVGCGSRSVLGFGRRVRWVPGNPRVGDANPVSGWQPSVARGVGSR